MLVTDGGALDSSCLKSLSGTDTGVLMRYFGDHQYHGDLREEEYGGGGRCGDL